MGRTNILCYFLMFYLSLGQISWGQNRIENLKNIDIFQSYQTDVFYLETTLAAQIINNLLVDSTDSPDLDSNFDIILEELILDYKRGSPPDCSAIQAKKLILSLKTLTGEYECNYYGHNILSKNYRMIGDRVRLLKRNETLRRIDKILLHYLNAHINNCGQVYFRKFDEVSKSFDGTLVKRLGIFLQEIVDKLTSEQNPDNRSEKYVENLFNLVSCRYNQSFQINSTYIYNAMKKLVQQDPDASFLRLVENEKTGFLNIRKDKFARLFNEYVAEPCQYFESKLGPDIFEPALFDTMFYRHIQVDRADFYEAWLKYRLCTYNGKISDKLDEVMDHANNQWKL